MIVKSLKGFTTKTVEFKVKLWHVVHNSGYCAVLFSRFSILKNTTPHVDESNWQVSKTKHVSLQFNVSNFSKVSQPVFEATKRDALADSRAQLRVHSDLRQRMTRASSHLRGGFHLDDCFCPVLLHNKKEIQDCIFLFFSPSRKHTLFISSFLLLMMFSFLARNAQQKYTTF